MKIKSLLLLMGIFIVGCGSNNKSETQFQGVTEKRDYTTEGLQYLAKSDIKKALLSFDQAIRQDPRNPKNYITLGEVYLRLKNYKSATDTFSGAAKVDPQNGDAYYFMGLSKALDGKIQEAVIDLQKSIDIFVQTREEQKFKLAVNLLKQLTKSTQPVKPQVQSSMGVSSKVQKETSAP